MSVFQSYLSPCLTAGQSGAEAGGLEPFNPTLVRV